MEELEDEERLIHTNKKKRSVKNLKISQAAENRAFKFEFSWDKLVETHSQFMVRHEDQIQIQKRIFIAVHPNIEALFTASEDMYIRVWNSVTHMIEKEKSLKLQPSAMEIHPITGDVLIIGFKSGQVMQINYKIKEGSYPEFTDIKFLDDPKIPKANVLSIKFSRNGRLLAVSYDNIYSKIEKFKVETVSHTSIY